MRNLYILLSAVLTIGWGTAVSADEGSSAHYAGHSVLATGHWAKIRVPASGIYELTDELLREAGFDSPEQVRVYGYGGAMQPELLTAAYLDAHDDLSEVPLCVVGGRRLFQAQGPVSWATVQADLRSRNPYSDHGYYFLTDSGPSPQVVDSAAFHAQYVLSPDYYHSLYEADDYCWYHGGRNLYDGRLFGEGVARSYELPAWSDRGSLTVVMSYNNYCDAEVLLNDSLVGSIIINSKTASSNVNRHLKAFPDQYSVAAVDFWTFSIPSGLRPVNTVTIRQTSGADMRLDYVALRSFEPCPMPRLSVDELPVPEYVGQVEPQDLHADGPADMVIIIPTARQLLSQAERLKQLHETYDQMRVRIVTADALYNEFSSGTPDANAYRRYLKMLYDRAQTADDAPRYLLLLGDAAWDNRMRSTNWRTTAPDDFLLCYESDNSFSVTQCYVSDDYFCLLDDGEGADMLTDKIDVAVGRLPARTEDEARVMVDKAISYRLNEHAGPWQNTLCFMADDVDDDRNRHVHQRDAEDVVKVVEQNSDAFDLRKIYWDVFTRVPTTTGGTYPDVSRAIRQQMHDGALVMNYSGHGAAYSLSHELIVYREDFATPALSHLPLWVTASCDIMPFDGQEANIGETAMLNPTGGAIAFFGTTRTVYAAWNRALNKSFMQHVLDAPGGVRNSLGEAARLTKNGFTVGSSRDMIINKQQFSLLGDPALVLAAPTATVVIDSIDGRAVADGPVVLSAGMASTVSGHIAGGDDFDGLVNINIRDVMETMVRRTRMDTITVRFNDRPRTVYVGTDSVRSGRFTIPFIVPKDISYAEGNCLVLAYAVNADHTLTAHGQTEALRLSGYDDQHDDQAGPDIACYLERPDFENGGRVSPTPTFHADLADPNGINVADGSFGHQLTLIVDGEPSRTYNLNSWFSYATGDYRQGSVDFDLPMLDLGRHRLMLKAWDMFNNSSAVTLDFVVVPPAGVAEVTTDGPSDYDLYDLQGRRLSSSAERRGAVVLRRDAQGRVKKMVARGQ